MNKLILFDWGNVLLNSNSDEYTIFDARNDIASELKPKDNEKFMLIFDSKEFWTFSGIKLNLFIEAMLTVSGCKCDVNDFKKCYLKHYRKVPWYKNMKNLIKTLTTDNRFHVGILSTLCEMDLQLLQENLPLDKFDYRFFSFNLGVQKPDIKIYDIIEMTTGYAGKDILFIDDAQQNIVTAAMKGWNTLLATGNDSKKICNICYSFVGID